MERILTDLTTMKPFVTCILLAMLIPDQVVAQDDMTKEELETWFENDDIAPSQPTSEGELRFLSQLPANPPIHSYNKITITQQSIKDGWVSLYQCYSQLDPVHETVIAYRYKAMRNLAIESKHKILGTNIKAQNVELFDVQKGAKLCVTAEVKILYNNYHGRYRLVNGPFHRQFLNSYFPFKLTMDVHYPSTNLVFVNSIPKSQSGFVVEKKPNNIYIETIFIGKIKTELLFKTHK